MENIVGRNMVSLDEKLKEVEHQLRSELEKSAQECVEDRMKTIENRMKKEIIQSSCAGIILYVVAVSCKCVTEK